MLGPPPLAPPPPTLQLSHLLLERAQETASRVSAGIPPSAEIPSNPSLGAVHHALGSLQAAITELSSCVAARAAAAAAMPPSPISRLLRARASIRQEAPTGHEFVAKMKRALDSVIDLETYSASISSAPSFPPHRVGGSTTLATSFPSDLAVAPHSVSDGTPEVQTDARRGAAATALVRLYGELLVGALGEEISKAQPPSHHCGARAQPDDGEEGDRHAGGVSTVPFPGHGADTAALAGPYALGGRDRVDTSIPALTRCARAAHRSVRAALHGSVVDPKVE